jgi:hypothetical protein
MTCADAPLEADLHMFHRIDTEFSNRQWRKVFERFAGLPVLIVAAGVVDVRGALAEVRGGLRRGRSRAGWVRTAARMEAVWRRTHDGSPVDLGDLPAWRLMPQS